ncbi:hypothetical protein [Fluviicola chungangensis]|uniref:ABM domain-containing protein n=1 Tax=Fluviicola chungangensis TaxID=2597671 RepID=A0A556N767_9FLAO|nr:hypothetical protein [Fluviicola chungangensis]TSJ47995.1 hypothetical protein FO442_02355 [Fluviicola chungangensis]
MKKVFIQYKIKPEQVSNVETLIKKVFDELRATNPNSISYSAQKLEDGQTFVHTYVANENVKNPIVGLSSFKELQEFIKFNHLEKPVSIELSDIDSYNSLS